ncbi:MAG: hypothetical protein ACRDRD_21960, partial [Pseudonocardiaceae bacterium]
SGGGAAPEISCDAEPNGHHPTVQIRRRRAASRRCEPLPGGRRDPWGDESGDWTDPALDSLEVAAQHLTALGLYGRWQAPEPARASRGHHRPAQRDSGAR